VESWLDNSKVLEKMKKTNTPEDKQKEIIEMLRSFLMVKYMPKMLEKFRKEFKRPFPISDISLVTSTCKLFDAIFETTTDSLN